MGTSDKGTVQSQILKTIEHMKDIRRKLSPLRGFPVREFSLFFLIHTMDL